MATTVAAALRGVAIAVRSTGTPLIVRVPGIVPAALEPVTVVEVGSVREPESPLEAVLLDVEAVLADLLVRR